MSKESDCSSALDVSNLPILDIDEFIENDNPYFKESPWWRQNTSVEFLDDDEPPQPEFVEFIFQNFAEVCLQVLGGSEVKGGLLSSYHSQKVNLKISILEILHN